MAFLLPLGKIFFENIDPVASPNTPKTPIIVLYKITYYLSQPNFTVNIPEVLEAWAIEYPLWMAPIPKQSAYIINEKILGLTSSIFWVASTLRKC